MPTPPGLRPLLRLLPCRPAHVHRFRTDIVEYVRKRPASAELDALSREYAFHLKAQAHLMDLNMRYFPQSGMSERELIGKIANKVGFKAPEWKDPS